MLRAHIRHPAPWDVETAAQVVEAVASMLGTTTQALIEQVRARMTGMVVAEILHFLTGQPVPAEKDGNNSSLGRWMFDQNIDRSDPFLGCEIQLKVPLVGIGAPARAFLEPVARALGTQIQFPNHYEVANAVGAVVGNVLIQKDAEVLPVSNGPSITGYVARVGSQQCSFEKLSEALAYTRSEVAEQARAEAIEAGAGQPAVQVTEQELLGGMYQLSAQALGKPALEEGALLDGAVSGAMSMDMSG
jgi:hypothetical protein